MDSRAKRQCVTKDTEDNDGDVQRHESAHAVFKVDDLLLQILYSLWNTDVASLCVARRVCRWWARMGARVVYKLYYSFKTPPSELNSMRAFLSVALFKVSVSTTAIVARTWSRFVRAHTELESIALVVPGPRVFVTQIVGRTPKDRSHQSFVLRPRKPIVLDISIYGRTSNVIDVQQSRDKLPFTLVSSHRQEWYDSWTALTATQFYRFRTLHSGYGLPAPGNTFALVDRSPTNSAQVDLRIVFVLSELDTLCKHELEYLQQPPVTSIVYADCDVSGVVPAGTEIRRGARELWETIQLTMELWRCNETL